MALAVVVVVVVVVVVAVAAMLAEEDIVVELRTVSELTPSPPSLPLAFPATTVRA